MIHNENRTEIHTTKGLSHDMDQMYHFVSSNHEIHLRISYMLGSIRMIFIFRVKSKMKNQRIGFSYLRVYGIKDTLDIARNICTMKMQFVISILPNIIQCLLRELTHPFKIQVCLLSVKSISSSDNFILSANSFSLS